MRDGAPVRDLIILAADQDIEQAMLGLLTRTESLGIRVITHDVLREPNRDSGCLQRSPEFLRSFQYRYRNALVVFDRDGCGRDASAREIEADVESRLSTSGWGGRGAAIVLDPEVEAWVWSDSPHVAASLGWPAGNAHLREWLSGNGFLSPGQAKPEKPKEALAAARRHARKPRSAALFFDLASKVGIQRCADPALVRLLAVLRAWFPIAD